MTKKLYKSRLDKREEKFKSAYMKYMQELNQTIDYVRTGRNGRTNETFSEERIAVKF